MRLLHGANINATFLKPVLATIGELSLTSSRPFQRPRTPPLRLRLLPESGIQSEWPQVAQGRLKTISNRIVSIAVFRIMTRYLPVGFDSLYHTQNRDKLRPMRPQGLRISFGFVASVTGTRKESRVAVALSTLFFGFFPRLTRS